VQPLEPDVVWEADEQLAVIVVLLVTVTVDFATVVVKLVVGPDMVTLDVTVESKVLVVVVTETGARNALQVFSPVFNSPGAQAA
jgi:hypothetical protein